jgi:hypothetical protein
MARVKPATLGGRDSLGSGEVALAMRSARLGASAALSAAARIELPRRISRDLLPMTQGCAHIQVVGRGRSNFSARGGPSSSTAAELRDVLFAALPAQCGSSPPQNTFGASGAGCSSEPVLPALYPALISVSSSLLAATMNQKSSLREDPRFVSWTLTGNRPDTLDHTHISP